MYGELGYTKIKPYSTFGPGLAKRSLVKPVLSLCGLKLKDVRMLLSGLRSVVGARYWSGEEYLGKL